MTYQKYVLDPAEQALLGKEVGIPMGLKTYTQVVNNIQQRVYTLFGGPSGSGKTSVVDFLYVFIPYAWYLKNKDSSDIKLKVVYRSMERAKSYKVQKWTALLMMLRHGILIDVPTMNGWAGKKFGMTRELIEKLKDCEEFIEGMLSGGVIDLVDGSENPTGIYHNLQQHAASLGKEEVTPIHGENGEVLYKEKKFTPHNANQYFICIIDHIGKVSGERRDGKWLDRKPLLDKLSEYMVICRDLYGMSPVLISQFNRGLADSQRMKNKPLAPELEDFKDTGCTQEDADVVVGLYNPYRLKDFQHLGYDVPKFVNKATGENRLRTLHILKNSYGVDDVVIPINFVGENGFIRQILSPEKITGLEYKRWVDDPLVNPIDDSYLIDLLKQK